MHVHEARARGTRRQLDLREVHSAQRGTDIGIFDQLSGDFQTDTFLCFFRRPTDMWGEDYIFQPLNRRDELVIVGSWLNREHVDGSTCKMPFLQNLRQSFQIDNSTARIVDEEGSFFILRSFASVISFEVDLFDGTCRLTTSEIFNSSSRLTVGLTLPYCSLSDVSK